MPAGGKEGTNLDDLASQHRIGDILQIIGHIAEESVKMLVIFRVRASVGDHSTEYVELDRVLEARCTRRP